MKYTPIAAVLVLILTTTAALAFSLPAHQQNGWRDTGCDETAKVEIKNAAGKVLYVNNATCPGSAGGDQGTLSLAALIDLLRNEPAK